MFSLKKKKYIFCYFFLHNPRNSVSFVDYNGCKDNCNSSICCPVGMHHYGRKELHVGVGYKLKREPENKYHANAVSIHDRDS